MNIRNLLLDRQRALFVGREDEFEMFSQVLSDPDWHLVNFHGPGGIGKTTLLRRFAQSLEPARCLYFDGQNGFPSPNDFLLKMQEALDERQTTVEQLNEYAALQQGIVLLVDTFEQCTAIENWFREEFLPRLSPQVKVFIAGRYALTGHWLRGNWHLLVRNIELKPLSANEIRQYAFTLGIEHNDIIIALRRFSKGVPLALSMACEIIVRHGRTNFLDHPEQMQMFGYLTTELLKDIATSDLKKYAEATTVTWKFDQELLQSMLQETIPTNTFREFCELPFVIRQDTRWSIHDSIRNWIYTDFRSRMPQTFNGYRMRALSTLREREMNNPNDKAAITLEKIFLHDHDFIRNFCFLWEDRLTLRECTQQEIPQIKNLYLRHLHNQPNYIPGDLHLEQLISPLLETDPCSFLGLYKEEQLVAFTACNRLTEHTIQIFKENPITSLAVSRSIPEQRQYLISLAGVDPDLEGEISGSLAHAMAKLIDRDAYIINLLPIKEWGFFLSLLGYERIPWADSTSPCGTSYQAYLLDLRKEELISKIDRLNERRPALEEAVKLVQRALKHYSRLPLYPETARSLLSLLPDQYLNENIEMTIRRLQDEIQMILQRFSVGSKEEQRYYQILYYAYIRKIGSHETVAEFLNIPTPSYFRYLRTAVRKLAYELIQPTLHT